MKKLFLLLITCAIIYQIEFAKHKIQQAPGVLASEDPLQENISHSQPFSFKNYTITPLANFDMTARVLSRENYYTGREADLSPVDFAMGWGPMSDSQVLSKISIAQSGRWYHWQVDAFPIPRRDIETHSANMHMIPADDSVNNTLANVRTGNIIILHGKLVRIDATDGWHWQSSLTRDDTGDGACEVIYVEDLSIKN
jgi:hypothetical protein